MFEYLKDYKYIFVSGMQRSGTTICMRMIQYDIEAPNCVWSGNNLDRIIRLEATAKKYSIELSYPVIFHCPGLSHLVHALKPEDGESAVIWMKRDKKEIVDSALRVESWDSSQGLKFYNVTPTGNRETDVDLLLTVKEARWEEQKKIIKNWFEIDYNSLKSHRLWVDKEDRGFYHNSRHTSPGLAKIIKDDCNFMDGGELEHLLKEFPKDGK